VSNGRRDDAAAGAKLMVLFVGLAWGVNWVAGRIILTALPPWAMRTVGIGLGTLTLFAAAAIWRVRLTVPRAEAVKILIAGFFNVAVFNVCSAYAQVYGTTSRAIVIAYSMPIWAALLARVVLKEQLSAVKLAALALCAAGLTTLIWPLARAGFPLGALLALGCAWSWAAGTIYLKWADIRAPMLAAAAWQLLFGWLLTPVVGVIGSAIIVGERPNLTDAIGFGLIFSAAACVLLQPNVKHVELPE
jgi:drug/metabolite transporter (DMT)-like permease